MVLSACSETQTETKINKALPVSKQTKTEIMDISTIKNQYLRQSKLFNNVLQDIKDEEANRRISEKVNSLKWIAGHTLDIQYNLAALTGITAENPYAENFAFGKKFDANAAYPSLSKMISDFNGLTSNISAALDKMTTQQLNSDPPFPIPFPEQSIRGLLAFQMHHLGYEIGQMGLYRKYLGKPAMSYQ